MKRLFGLFDNPKLMRRITGSLIIVSIVEWIAASMFGWVDSVAYVSHLSQLAITISLIPWHQGLRLEVQSEEADVAAEVAAHLLEKTNLEEAESNQNLST